jgi:hypothetical protein
VPRQFFHHADTEYALLSRVVQDVNPRKGQHDVSQDIRHRYRLSILLTQRKPSLFWDASMAGKRSHSCPESGAV